MNAPESGGGSPPRQLAEVVREMGSHEVRNEIVHDGEGGARWRIGVGRRQNVRSSSQGRVTQVAIDREECSLQREHRRIVSGPAVFAPGIGSRARWESRRAGSGRALRVQAGTWIVQRSLA